MDGWMDLMRYGDMVDDLDTEVLRSWSYEALADLLYLFFSIP